MTHSKKSGSAPQAQATRHSPPMTLIGLNHVAKCVSLTCPAIPSRQSFQITPESMFLLPDAALEEAQSQIKKLFTRLLTGVDKPGDFTDGTVSERHPSFNGFYCSTGTVNTFGSNATESEASNAKNSGGQRTKLNYALRSVITNNRFYKHSGIPKTLVKQQVMDTALLHSCAYFAYPAVSRIRGITGYHG